MSAFAFLTMVTLFYMITNTQVSSSEDNTNDPKDPSMAQMAYLKAPEETREQFALSTTPGMTIRPEKQKASENNARTMSQPTASPAELKDKPTSSQDAMILKGQVPARVMIARASWHEYNAKSPEEEEDYDATTQSTTEETISQSAEENWPTVNPKESPPEIDLKFTQYVAILTARPTLPLPDFKIPFGEKGNEFREKFALYNCQLMSSCNVLPRERSCARDSFLGTVGWFDNICTLWKCNCIKKGMFFVQNSSMCEDFHLRYPGMQPLNITAEMVNHPAYLIFPRPKITP